MRIFGRELDKTIVIFETNSFKFVKMQSSHSRKKNLGPKLSYLGIFGLEFEKTIVIFEIVPLNLSKCKLYFKKIGNETALFGFFGLEFQKVYYQI